MFSTHDVTARPAPEPPGEGLAGEGLAGEGKRLARDGRLREAEDTLRAALAAAPDSAPIVQQLVAVLFAELRPDEALAEAASFAARRPGLANAHHTHAVALLRAGRLDEATQAAEQAIALETGNGEHYYLLAGIKRFRPDDRHFHAMQRLRRQRGLPPSWRKALLLALAKAYRDVGEHHCADEVLREAGCGAHDLP